MQARRRRLSPVAVFLALAGSLLLGVVVATTDVGTDAVLVIGIALTIAAPVVRRLSRGRFDVFEPIVLFAVAYGVMFVIRPAADLSANALVYSIANVGVSIEDTYTEMLALALLGAFGFVVGYELPHKRRHVHANSVPPRKTATLVSGGVIMTFVGMAAFVGYIGALGGISALPLTLQGRSQALQLAEAGVTHYLPLGYALLSPAALTLLAVGLAEKRRAVVLLSAVPALTLLVLSSPRGDRGLLLPLILGAVIVYYVTKNRRPAPRLVLIVALVGLAASSFVAQVRYVESREASSLSRFIEQRLTPEAVFAPILEGHDAAMAPALAAMLTVVPEQNAFKYGGATLGDLVTRPVPRQLWPEKPRTPKEEIVSALWPGLFTYRVANPEFSPLYAFYYDIGAVGGFVGLFLYGFIFRRVYEYYRTRSSDLGARLLFAGAAPLVVIALRDGPVDTMIRSLAVLGPIPVALYLARGRPRPAGVVNSRGGRQVERRQLETLRPETSERQKQQSGGSEPRNRLSLRALIPRRVRRGGPLTSSQVLGVLARWPSAELTR